MTRKSDLPDGHANKPFMAENDKPGLRVWFFHPLGYLGLDQAIGKFGYYPKVDFQAWTGEGSEPGFNLMLVMQ